MADIFRVLEGVAASYSSVICVDKRTSVASDAEELGMIWREVGDYVNQGISVVEATSGVSRQDRETNEQLELFSNSKAS